MRIIRCLLAGLGLFLFIGLVQADSGWTELATVGELRATGMHYYVVRIDVKQNPSGCDQKGWFYQDYGLAGSDKMFLTLLEAVKSGFAVRVYVTGKCNLHGYSEFTSVSVTR